MRERLTDDERVVLRVLGAAGGALTLMRIVDAFVANTATSQAPGVGRWSLRIPKATACLDVQGLIERRPRSNKRVLTEAGRAALTEAAQRA